MGQPHVAIERDRKQKCQIDNPGNCLNRSANVNLIKNNIITKTVAFCLQSLRTLVVD